MRSLPTTMLQCLLAILLATAAHVVLAQKPEITSISQTSGRNGDLISIHGSFFGNAPADLDVVFGAVSATIVSASDQLIEVHAPGPSTYGPIRVTRLSSGLSATSRENFLLSFGGAFGIDASKLEGQKDFNAEAGLYDLCSCDLDGDGKVDVATANDNATSIAIFRNASTGPSLPQLLFDKTSVFLNTRSLHVTCGDLNGDGKPDLALTEGGATGDRLFILRNTSAGPGAITFSTQAITLAGRKVKRVKMADLNGDGKPELVVTNQSGNNIAVLINQSTTATISFNPTPVNLTIASAASTDGLELSDLNGDGLPEIIASQFLTASSNVFILANQSAAGTMAFGTPLVLTIGSTVVNLRVGDLDLDGLPDIAATQLLGSSISIFRNQSSGAALAFSSPFPITVDAGPFGIDIGDLDGDGKPDLVIPSLTRKTISILNNKSAPGNFSFDVAIKATTFINRHLSIGDLDSDGKPDIVFASVDDNNNAVPASKVSVFRNALCPTPRIGPDGPHVICAGFPLQLTTSPALGTTFEWKNAGGTVASGSDAFFDVTASGNYTVTAISEGGACALSSNAIQVTVESGTLAGAPTASNNGPICIGSDLELSVNDVGATRYEWTGPEGFALTGRTVDVSDFQQANAGRYTVKLFVNDCLAGESSTLAEAIAVPDFSINTGGTGVVCAPDTKTLTVVPPTPGFTYQWYEESAGLLSGATTATYDATASGTYTVEIEYTANPACGAITTDPAVITFATSPIADFTFDDPGCVGQDIAFTNQSSKDPTVQTSFEWSFGDGGTSGEIDPVHRYLTASNFSVTLKIFYAGGACLNEQTKQIQIVAAPAVSITAPGNDFSFCPGESVALSVSGTFPSYQWSTGATTQTITASEEGNYIVNVTTDNGCVISASQQVSELDAPIVTITAQPEAINEGESSQLSASGLEDYLWSPEDGLSSPVIPNPVATPLTTTLYTVTGTGNNGCPGEGTIEVRVNEGSPSAKLTPSKLFSPNNGDAIGNFWLVERIEDFPQCQVTVFDDKGVQVFQAKPYQNNWDGTFNGKELPDGVYYFIINCEGDSNPPKTGSITLIR